MGGNSIYTLTFDKASASAVARFQAYETVNVTNNAELTFDANLTLGDFAGDTGALIVDASGTLFGGGTNASVLPLATGQ